jgi:Universal stress protein family
MVEEGKPIDVILRAAKALGGDLIVTGIARDETLGRFGLGTTVDRLLRRSKVPVLIVKQRVRRLTSTSSSPPTFRNSRGMRFKPQHDFFRIRSSASFMRMGRRSRGSHLTPRVTKTSTARSLPANSRRAWQRSICLVAASADRNSWSSAENRMC